MERPRAVRQAAARLGREPDLLQRALDLIPAERRAGEPAAWNLGIAATARRDWRTARAAWTAYGATVDGATDRPTDGPADGPTDGPTDGPVAADLGPSPLRLNPPPRYRGQTPVRVDGRTWDTEVVWGRRIDPARIEVLSVPLPASGHRHRDVVLHDGVPEGTRRLGDEELPVFDEIELWERSPRPTLSVVVTAADQDVAALLSALEDAGVVAEDWTSAVHHLCEACSRGSVGAHDHPAVPPADTGRTIGISAFPADAEPVLDAWVAAGPGRHRAPVVVELE